MMKYRMGEITALEMREILRARPVVLLPLGSFEDQGPHAPMGDFLSADAIAELATDGELVPNALDKRVHEAVAAAVKEAAERSGIARPERANTDL